MHKRPMRLCEESRHPTEVQAYLPAEDNIRDNLLRIWVLDPKKWFAGVAA